MMESKIEIDLRLLERAEGGEFDSMFKDSPWTGTMGHVAREYRTLKTINEALNGTVAMLREAIQIAHDLHSSLLSKPRTQKACEIQMESVVETIIGPALTATEATVKEWLAKRDEEFAIMMTRSINLASENHGMLGKVKKLEATLAEKENDLAVIKNENKSLSDAYSEVSHDQKKAEEALAKWDKEAN